MPAAVHVQLQLRIVSDDGTVFTDSEILRPEKSAEWLGTLGLSLREAKTLQERLQQHVVTAQAAAYVNRHRCCPACGGSVRSRAKMGQNHNGWCLMDVEESLHLVSWRET
jgi:hypothetical protein